MPCIQPSDVVHSAIQPRPPCLLHWRRQVLVEADPVLLSVQSEEEINQLCKTVVHVRHYILLSYCAYTGTMRYVALLRRWSLIRESGAHIFFLEFTPLLDSRVNIF